jgi:2'-5' RNA ligase
MASFSAQIQSVVENPANREPDPKMSEQLSFDGFEPPRPPARLRDMLLFATHIEGRAALEAPKLARALIGEHDLGGRPQSNPHVTLQPIGDYATAPQRLIDLLRAAGALVTGSSFDVVCERVARWGGKGGIGPLVMLPGEGSVEFMGLHRAIRSAIDLVAPGLLPKWAFTPHVTLARTRMIDEHAIAPIRWTVREFSLVRSLQREGRHVVLGSWPLRS